MNLYHRDRVFMMIGDQVSKEEIEEELNHTDNINRVDSVGLSYLHKAVLCYRTEIVELLLKKGIEVDSVDARGNTPLSYAIGTLHSEVPKMVRLLLRSGANLDFDLGENTIRETIISFEDPELMQVVIESEGSQPKREDE